MHPEFDYIVQTDLILLTGSPGQFEHGPNPVIFGHLLASGQIAIGKRWWQIPWPTRNREE